MRARGRKAAYGAAARRPAAGPVGAAARGVRRGHVRSAQQDTRGSHHATEDPDEADDFLLTDSGLAQRILTSPGVLLFIACWS